jgi:acetyltransferase-like isoleucine patch superfamily enzyme
MCDKLFFRTKQKMDACFFSPIRKIILKTQGMKIGRGTIPAIRVNWPHQVQIGDTCHLEHGVYFKFDGIWSPGPSIVVGNRVFIGANVEFNISRGLNIGDDCLIASGCKFVDHDHGMELSIPMNRQSLAEAKINIGSGVWLGYDCIVLKGCQIGEEAVVAAGAVVNQDIPPYEIWGGVPARKIGKRM